MEIPTRSPPLDTGVHMFGAALARTSYMLTIQITGKQAAMSLSLRLLHRFRHDIPTRIHSSYPRLGSSACHASLFLPHSHFQWIRPPNIVIGGNDGTVSLHCTHVLGKD